MKQKNANRTKKIVLLLFSFLLLLFIVPNTLAQSTKTEELYVIGHENSFPLESKSDGEWIGMMPQLFTTLSKMTDYDFVYIDGDGDERINYIANNQVEIISLVREDEAEEFVNEYSIVLSDEIFQYEGQSYYIGFTEIASQTVINDLNAAINEISTFEYIEKALNTANLHSKSNYDYIIKMIIEVTIVILLIVIIVLAILYKRRGRYKYRRSGFDAVENLKTFEFKLKSLVGINLQSLYYVALYKLDLNMIKLYFGIEDSEKCMEIVYQQLKEYFKKDRFILRESENGFLIIFNATNDTEVNELLSGSSDIINKAISMDYSSVNVGLIAGACPASLFENHFDDAMGAFKVAVGDAKQKEKSKIICDEEMIKTYIGKIHLNKQLVNQKNFSDFVVHFMPVVSMKNKKIKGANALVRWDNKENGLLQPNEFLNFFDSTGKIMQLNYWVFRNVCQWISVQNQEKLKNKTISLKMSLANFQDRDFKKIVLTTMQQYRFQRNILALEVDSSVAISRDEIVVDNLQLVQQLGVNIILGNYGGENTTLATFKEYNDKILKLAPDFTKNMVDEGNITILKSIVQIGHAIGMKIMCDMVQTIEQAHLYEQLHVDYLSGFYFYYPMPLDEFSKLLD